MQRLNRAARLQVAVAVAVGTLGVCSSGTAAIYDDAAGGAWSAPATWTTEDAVLTPSTDADNVIIDEFTVTATVNTSTTTGTFTGGEVHIAGTGVLSITNNYQNQATTPRLNVYLNGGTFNMGSGNTFRGPVSGAFQFISVSGVSTIRDSGDGNTVGASTRQTYLTGAGTLIKAGGGLLTLEADNTDLTNPSDFSGLLDIQQGGVRVNNANMLKNARVNLGGTGTKLSIHHGTTVLASQAVLQGLSGSGMVEFTNSGYARDLVMASGAVMSPGTASAPGTITRGGATSSVGSNELIFRTGTQGNSKLEMDIFGPTQLDADLVSWLDTPGTSTVDFRNADLVVRLYTPESDLGLTSWTLVEADQFGVATNQSGSAASASEITFSSISFVADAGWSDLAISYDYTLGNSKVVLTGRYEAIPEPGMIGLVVGVAMMIAGRRRRVA